MGISPLVSVSSSFVEDGGVTGSGLPEIHEGTSFLILAIHSELYSSATHPCKLENPLITSV